MLNGVRNGHKPCTRCGGARDFARKHPKFGMVANPECRKCHSLLAADWIASNPERYKKCQDKHKSKRPIYHLRYYKKHRALEIQRMRAYYRRINTEGIA